MMERLLTVTSGYLKFTFACLAGSATIFALASLAVTSPKAFFIVLAAGLTVFLVVRMEIKDHRREQEIGLGSRANPNAAKEAAAEVLAFSEGLATAVGSLVLFPDDQIIAVPEKIQSLLVTQWTFNHDPESPSLSSLDADEIAFVSKRLGSYRKELAEIGVYLVFVSTAPPQALIKMMREKPYTQGWGNTVFIRQAAAKSGKAISIGFLSTRPHSWPDQLEKIMQSGFRIVHGAVLEVTKS